MVLVAVWEPGSVCSKGNCPSSDDASFRNHAQPHISSQTTLAADLMDAALTAADTIDRHNPVTKKRA
jgi:hypothetical protein